MNLRTVWIDLLYKSATSTRKIRTLLTPFGAVIFGLFITLFIFIAVKVDNIFVFPRLLHYPWFIIIAFPLLMIGFMLTGWSVFHFLKVKGTPVPLNPPPELVTSGPYRYARNPMLSGVFLIMFGIGFLIQSFSLTLIFTPVFIIVNVLELKYIEEPELEKRLGNAYSDYKMKTPMFFPGLKQTYKVGDK